MVFDREWFLKHQKVLLFFANTWFGRRILCIDGTKSSVGKYKIIRLDPNAITWFSGEYKVDKRFKNPQDSRLKFYKTEFRTHAKFSKRLFYAFLPIWRVIHVWDTLFANPFAPQWNLGFDTLGPIYPDAGSGGTTVDGVVSSTGSQTFATHRAGGGTLGANVTRTNSVAYLAALSTSNPNFSEFSRSIDTYDTSLLTNTATISAVTASVYGLGKGNGLGEEDLHLAGATPASNNNLVGADFTQVQFTSFGNVTYAGFTSSAYNDISLNASGIANISKTGISKFSWLMSWDINNSFTGAWATNGESYQSWSSADTAGTSQDPKIVVTYTLSSGEAGYSFFI